jgi:ATP-grasp domain, R2K clade family 3
MHWILQDNLFNEAAYQTLLDTLERMELPYSIHKVVPFVGELIPEPDVSHYNVICMGSYSLRHAADKYQWEPGVFDLEPEDFTVQMKHWGSHMLNADAVVCAFKDALAVTPNWRQDGDMFVRPIEDSKVFAGKVFDVEEFSDWHNKVCVLEEDYGNSLTKDTLIQICHPKMIFAEYRFWIVKGKIVTKSMYKRGPKVMYSSDVDERFDEYVKERVKEWQPHEAFVIDVCDTPDGIKIVEINTLNSCGFYAADIPMLVDALEYAFNDPEIVPDVGTKAYDRILAEGCKGTRDYWGEYDCEYSWTCDNCPIVTSKYEPEEDEKTITLWSCDPSETKPWTQEDKDRLDAVLERYVLKENRDEAGTGQDGSSPEGQV